MKYLLSMTILSSIMLAACVETDSPIDIKEEDTIIAYNEALAKELEEMVKLDQKVAGLPFGKYEGNSADHPNWIAFRDSVFAEHNDRLGEILDEYGYPGFDLVGEEGEENFWLLSQHADLEPGLQTRLLKQMKIAVDAEKAVPKHYAYLSDRVSINSGQGQLYGTQLTYDTEICRAIPKEINDSSQVDQRRTALGLSPLIEYLNQATSLHFEMNKAHYESIGIDKPNLYEPQ